MLKLTKKADYGLIAMRHLAGRSAQSACSAKDVADAHGIPPELLAKILQRLVKKGLLVRTNDRMDARRVFVSLSSGAFDAMEGYFASIPEFCSPDE